MNFQFSCCVILRSDGLKTISLITDIGNHITSDINVGKFYKMITTLFSDIIIIIELVKDEIYGNW